MRGVKRSLIGILVVLLVGGGLTAVAHLRPHHHGRLAHVQDFMARATGVVHASQSRRASPHESTEGMVDGATITVTYGRPSMRGRTIFGRLIPYGRVWCPGADEATTLDSSRDLRIGEVRVPAGPHTIWVLPTAEMWTLIVSKEPNGFHTNYNPSADLGRVDLLKRSLDAPVEQLTFAVVNNPAGRGGSLTMAWETTEVSVPFTVQ